MFRRDGVGDRGRGSGGGGAGRDCRQRLISIDYQTLDLRGGGGGGRGNLRGALRDMS